MSTENKDPTKEQAEEQAEKADSEETAEKADAQDAPRLSVVTDEEFALRSKPLFSETPAPEPSAPEAEPKSETETEAESTTEATPLLEPELEAAYQPPAQRGSNETLRAVRHAATDVGDSVRALITELIPGNASRDELGPLEPGALVKAEPRRRVAARAVDTFIFILLAKSITFIGPLAALAYLLFGDAIVDGASLGKRLFKLRAVTADDEQPVGLFDSLLRNAPLGLAGLFVLIPVIGWFLFGTLGLLVLGFEAVMIWRDDQGVRAGDILAGTKVIEQRDDAAADNSAAGDDQG